MAIESFRDDNFYLSNMYVFENGIRTPDGEVVHTSEQLYLPSRFSGQAARQVIQRAPNGFDAKSISNSLVKAQSPVIPEWNLVKIDKMRAAVLAKFIANPDIAERLIGTGEEELIEGNKRKDNFWGVYPPPPHGTGQNWLGRILMETRTALQDPLTLEADPAVIVAGIYAPVDLYEGIH